MLTSTIQLGALSIGGVPRVVGTISDYDCLVRFSGRREKHCDIAEVRLDEIGVERDWLAACRAIEQAEIPTILTIRLDSDGGKWNRSDDERKALFEKAISHVSAIDVEISSALVSKWLWDLSERYSKPVLLSYHNYSATPTFDELIKIASVAYDNGQLLKISTMVRSPSDVETLQGLLARDWNAPLCVIGMGSMGAHTRTSFPARGSCFTYGYLDRPSAPGQFPAQFLVERLREALPEYNEDFVIRNKVLEFA
ncbi:type I 3-dehydroquinate dehydratase [Patescibacteria group bacterium]|nr:type I 3-dehydroquinate dehydratase [Patescibacteria group bacterium]